MPGVLPSLRGGASRPTSLRRVLVVHPSPDLYGSDRVMLESVSGFIEAGADVTVALPTEGPLVALLRERGAKVVFCATPVLRKSALSPRGLVGLGRELLESARPATRLVRETDPDILYVSTVTIPGWIALGRALGRRVVCHVHEAEGSQPAAVKKLLYAPLLGAQQLVVNSRYALDVMSGAWPVLRGRSGIVHNAVPAPDEAEPLRADVTRPRLLFIGRLSPRKGPQVAVDALKQLVDAGIDAHLDLLGAVFPGYEWFEQQLREQVAGLGLTERVSFLGFRPDVWGTMASADIVLVPSTIDEPFGNTAVEAILAGRPLVVSDTSGLKEAAQGYACARFVAPEDPAALAGAVQSLLGDWDAVRGSIDADRRMAVERHSPATYRRTLVDQLTA